MEQYESIDFLVVTVCMASYLSAFLYSARCPYRSPRSYRGWFHIEHFIVAYLSTIYLPLALTTTGVIELAMFSLSLHTLVLGFLCTSIQAFPFSTVIPSRQEPPLVDRGTATPILGGQNFPDPGFVRTNDGWHAFSTNGLFNNSFVHLQKAYTPDWTTWQFTAGDDAMPVLASWIDPVSPRVWAPDPNVRADETFIMYYTAALKAKTSLHCVSYATSKNVEGPYVDSSTTPFICPQSQGGAIDPAGYLNQKDGTHWVTYKIDGNSIGHGGECGNR
jgi:hypothetical protein